MDLTNFAAQVLILLEEVGEHSLCTGSDPTGSVTGIIVLLASAQPTVFRLKKASTLGTNVNISGSTPADVYPDREEDGWNVALYCSSNSKKLIPFVASLSSCYSLVMMFNLRFHTNSV